MHTIRRTLTAQAVVLIALALLTARDGTAQAPEYAVLYSFQGDADGAEPNGVILENGKLYGMTFVGGANICGLNSFYPCGTVFELTPVKGAQWTKTILFSFNGTDGALPSQGLSGGTGPSPIFASNGVLYGTTQSGGSNDPNGSGLGGTVFALAPPAVAGGAWTETVLYSFSSSEQAPHSPYGGLLIGSSGELFGTTFSNARSPGASYYQGGTVFVVAPPAESGGTWTERNVANFDKDGLGALPMAGVVALGGSLYGTTWDIGGCGTVYEVSPPTIAGEAWTGTLIHSFGGPPSDGCNSFAPLTAGPDGVLYGTASIGGSATQCTVPPYLVSGCGVVFQLTPPETAGGAWTQTVIYSFTGTNGDGANPQAGVVLGQDGVLYGTTLLGGTATSGSPCSSFGASGCGTVFELTPPATPGGAWTETILHSFTGQDGDGSDPGPLFLSPSTGVLYGPTRGGGAFGQGTVFAVKP
jgi:hypothetical protein